MHWIKSETGFTRVGENGRSNAHLVRLDPETWGICTHWAPCVAWMRVSGDDRSDIAFADSVLAQGAP